MLNIYTSFECKTCGKEFVLLTEEIGEIKRNLVCPYCISKNIKRQKATDDLNECMQQRAYIRVNGALRQK